MGAQYGDLRGPFEKMISLLKQIERHTRNEECGCDTDPVTTTGGVDTSIPAGFKSISIVKTSNNGQPVTITLSDATTFDLVIQGQTFSDSSGGDVLPAYPIAGVGEHWSWHGIK